MTVKTQIAADPDAVFFNINEFAEMITYNGASIKALVSRKGARSISGEVHYGAFIWVMSKDVTAPAYRVPVVIGGATWLTGAPEDAEGGDGTWKIPLSLEGRPVPR